MKRVSTKINFLYNMLYEVIVLLLPLITTPYIARVLGATNVGIYNYVTANISYFTIFAAVGSSTYARREVAFCQNDREKQTETFYGILLLRIITTMLALTIFGGFLLIVSSNKIYYVLSLGSILAVALDIGWFFQGIEQYKPAVARNSLIKLMAMITIFSCVKDTKDLWLYFLINVGSTVLGNISLWFILPRYINRFDIKDYKLRKHLIGSIKLFIPVLAIQVYTVVDKTMLGIIIDETEVGYYSQAEKIVKIGLTVIDTLALVLLPRISSLISSKKYDEANQIYRKSIKMAILIALPAMLGCILVAEDFINIFLGEGYSVAIGTLQILSILFVVLGLARIVGTPLLIPLGREKKYTIAVCTGAFVNVVFNMLLIPKIGSYGAAIATIIAEASVTALEIWFIRDVFEISYISKCLRTYSQPTIVMSIIILGIYIVLSPGIGRLLISVGMGVGSYIILLVIKKDKLIEECLEMFKIKLKKNIDKQK